MRRTKIRRICRLVFILSITLFAQGIFAQGDNCSFLTVTPTNGPCYSASAIGSNVFFGNGATLMAVDFSDPDNPQKLSELLVGADIQDLEIKGDYVYVTAGHSGLLTIDVSNPSDLVKVNEQYFGFPQGITIAGNRLYVATRWQGVTVFDISNPAKPVTISWNDTPGEARDVAVKDRYAFVADGYEGIRVIDIKIYDEKAHLALNGMVRGIEIYGDYAYVANSGRGLAILDISDPTGLFEVKCIDTQGYVNDVTVKGHYAYVAAGRAGLRIFDLSDPENPIELSLFDTEGIACHVSVVGNQALIADMWGGFTVVDVSDPSAPVEVGHYRTGDGIKCVTAYRNQLFMARGVDGVYIYDNYFRNSQKEIGRFDTPGRARHVEVRGDYAYVADSKEGLRIFDISNPSQPGEVGFLDTPGNAHRVALRGEYAYIADWVKGLRIVRISDPHAPVEVGFFDTQRVARDIALKDDFAFIADGGDGVRVVQVSDPANPSEVAFFETDREARSLAIQGGYLYLAESWNGMRVLDISDPLHPREVSHFKENQDDISSVEVDGDYAYITGENEDLYIVDISDPTSPIRVGGFDPFGHPCGVALKGNYIYVGASGYGLITLRNELTNVVEFLTHATGDLRLSVFDNGVIGRNPFRKDGEGFLYKGNANALCAASFMVGTENGINGMLYNEFGDMIVAQTFQGFQSDGNFDQIGQSVFSDSTAKQRFGVTIRQTSYSNSQDNFVTLFYEIFNRSGSSLGDFYAGLFADWDIGSAGSNSGGYDPSRNLVYMYQTGNNVQDSCYYGIVSLAPLAGARVTVSREYSRRDSLFSWMTTFYDEPITEPGDYRTYMGCGPFNIKDGSKAEVAFAILAGDNLADLQHNADLALQGWDSGIVAVPKTVESWPGEFWLWQNYPNPFNPATMIEFSLPTAGYVSLKVYDILGRHVLTLVDAKKPAGVFRIKFDASELASGVYFYTLRAGDFKEMKKCLLIH